MKFYESHYEDYIHSVDKYNIHPEMRKIHEKFPKKISNLKNLIFYGPSGVGKYSQVLHLLKRYSPSELKYDKKMSFQTDKQTYTYRISDIHYEVDMSLLGCNSKMLWHEVFFQIIDIISVKPDKFGVIVCKNFHLIHGELLEIFYSYMQQYNHSQTNINVKFIIITEHLSFLPTPIINVSQIINLCRPSKYHLSKLVEYANDDAKVACPFLKKTALGTSEVVKQNTDNIMSAIDTNGIINIKELRSFALLHTTDEIPNDVFNIICDNIIKEMLQAEPLSFTGFRDTLYDILTYNLDVSECIWYILSYLIKNNSFAANDISSILSKTYSFLKYYNNNYRPIYHLESIMYYMITKIRKYNEL